MSEQPKLSAEARRAVTVEAVVKLAASANPSEITTADIAAHMKLTQGALFRHFPSKDALWLAVMEWAADRMLARVRAAAAGLASPLASMRAVFFAHLAFTAEYPGIPRLVFGELQRANVSPAKMMARALMQRYAQFLRALVEDGKNHGEIDAGVDADAAATMFIGMLQGLVMQSLLLDAAARARNPAEQIFAIFERGLRSPS